MTALTRPARPAEDAQLRPVPWRRMAWVTWRQHRVALAGVAAVLGAWVLYLWLDGLRIHHAYAAVTACRPASSLACGQGLSDFNLQYGDPAQVAAVLLQVMPALIGAFLGAPVMARELETGTFRFAWTQGFGRWRWALAKLVPLAAALTVVAWLFSLLFSWFYQPFFADGNNSPFEAELFDARGVSFAAWTLAAFAIGVLAGMLIRRVVPAIAATMAVWAGLAAATGLWLRQHYATPLLTSNQNLPNSAWIMSQWWTKGGRFAFTGLRDAPPGLLGRICPLTPPGPLEKPSPATFGQCLVQHGYTQWTSYQPGSRFWPFQWIEAGWLLALSALLIAATTYLVRRRAA